MKVTLFMKSGNKVVVRGVKTFDWTHQGGNLTSVSVTYNLVGRYVRGTFGGQLIGAVCLSQIEAVKVFKFFGM